MVFTLKPGIYLITGYLPDGYLPGIYWVFTLTGYLPGIYLGKYLHPGFYVFLK